MIQPISEQMRLELESGRLIFTESGNVLEPLLPLQTFLSWQIPEYVDPEFAEENQCDIELENTCFVSGMHFYCKLRFIDSQLVTIGLKNADSVFEKALFSWDTERDRQKTHDAWIAQNIGDQLIWPWGNVESYYDEVCWGATIFIHYKNIQQDRKAI